MSDRVLLIPQSVSAAGFFTDIAECGIVDWKVGIARDVSGRNCHETGPTDGPWYTQGSAKSYEVVATLPDRILGAYLEDDHDFNGSSPSRRPRAFLPYQYLRQTP